VRPGGLELPTFWFVGGICELQQTTPADKSLQNQREMLSAFGSFRLALYPVHGHSRGQFRTRGTGEGKRDRYQHDGLPTTMLGIYGPGKTTRLNLDARKHLLSLLQGNVGGRASSHFRRNQNGHADFRFDGVNRENQNRRKSVSISACLPDVPLQDSENIGVVLTVRECVRVFGSGKHAS
jgi:hypothetical protein